MTGFDPSVLRRWPDIESPELQAYDGADLLLLDTAGNLGALPGPAGTLVLVNDHYGALTLGSLHRGDRGIRVHQDALSGEHALAANARRLLPRALPAERPGSTSADEGGHVVPEYSPLPLAPELFSGARLILLQLPRSLDALREIADLVARYADPEVVVLAGGRVKHMSLAMNDVLGRYFASVTASRAERKSRILTASGLRADEDLPSQHFPLTADYDVGLAQPLRLRAFGATFGGAKLDPGTRFLLPQLAGARESASAVDLGSGNGSIAAYLALSRPTLNVLASDQSASAVASTRATAEANNVLDRVQAVRDDALSALPDASQELVVLNPPFHVGNTVHEAIALKLIADAGRVLVPGGELWCVWNSHLRYRPHLTRLVGPTRQTARNSRFTVTVSTRL